MSQSLYFFWSALLPGRAGVLAGSKVGPNLGMAMNPNAVTRTEPVNLGQCFVAIDPSWSVLGVWFPFLYFCALYFCACLLSILLYHSLLFLLSLRSFLFASLCMTDATYHAVSRFAEGYEDRLQMFVDQLHDLPTAADAAGPVLVPGDMVRASSTTLPVEPALFYFFYIFFCCSCMGRLGSLKFKV